MRRLCALPCIVAILLQLTPLPVEAETGSIGVTGSFATTTTSITPIGTDPTGDRIFGITFKGTFSGDMVGNFTRASQLTVHPDGTESYAALTLCSCSLLGKSGGLIFFDQGSGIFHGTFHGQSMIVSGSGGLSELRGSAAVAGSELSGAGTFVAQVHFE